MPDFTDHTLALCDGGGSRYGAYLAQHAGRFHDDGDPLRPAHFAAEAWTVATSPVMSPGYVRLRPDIADVRPAFDYNGGLLLRIEVRLRQRALADSLGPSGRFGDWWQHRPLGDDGRRPRLIEPEEYDRLAVLLTATLVVPVTDHLLPVPTATRGPELTEQARQAVHALAGVLNACAPPVNQLLAAGAPCGGGR
ncbi:hypothetical protein PUR71_33250 [Streptomyces sp. SP17BM10]|uniref:hypothetical protein n=1 Tax=Streptomyces sp. SP17BM10 TaxID=3002530 RepID=UPI002E770E42|nr:hypothetical protein [Streptomyces sp. SP17BM10]MEE1787739.1 hypothetical protein [Streptomyces sp. SP17BM10]